MQSIEKIDTLWILFCAILVFVMQAGFMCVEAGSTRNKNNINTALKNISDFGIATLGFWAFGYGILYGVSSYGLVGSSNFFTHSTKMEEVAWFVYQAAFCGAAMTIVAGAVAERLKFTSYLFITMFGSIFIYPFIGHWVWNDLGWLKALGFVDFAGATVVHSTGGSIALAVIILLGPRIGKFRKDGTPREFNGSNVPLALLGSILLFFGWFGFNGGGTGSFSENVPFILSNTLLSSASAVVTMVVLGLVVYDRVHVSRMMNGLLGGLVSITACADSVISYEAVIIGSIGSVIVLCSEAILLKFKLDDVVGAIPVHLGAGIWGTLAVAIFGDPDILNTGLNASEQMGVQLFGSLFCCAIAFTLSFIFVFLLNRVWGIRVSRASEEAGLNVSEHRANDDVEELLNVMQEQAESRDFDMKADQEPFSHAGRIGLHYNNLVWSLRDSIEETDGILKKILPEDAAEKLKQGQHVSDSYEEVTILFIDIVGFTKLTHSLVARRVVSVLNDIFKTFDRQGKIFGVEKIKTIGDGYMAVSGLEKGQEHHAENAIRTALGVKREIIQFNEQNKFDLDIRVGINSGPVIGGVIGDDRFIYDLWGDAVNLASRMESTGVPGKIQISEATYDLVKLVNDFQFELRENVEVKGRGLVNTYFVSTDFGDDHPS
jgi:Amt family ammonium transporter